MNAKQAKEEGLMFTGHYSQNKEEIKNTIKILHKEYPKARMMIISECDGYSIHVDAVYRAYQTKENTERAINQKDFTIESITKEYNERILFINKSHEYNLKLLEEANNIINNA